MRTRATRVADTDTTDEILAAAVEHAKESGYCKPVRFARDAPGTTVTLNPV
jgi:hypothetical protein